MHLETLRTPKHEIITKGSELCDIILEHDFDTDRSFKVWQMVKQAISVYQVLLKEKKKQKNHLLPARCQEAKGGGKGRSGTSVEEVVAAAEDEGEEEVDDVEAVEVADDV
ncbi:hypothetical protein E2C01_065914 [Portunus trituberculatus]|uniref:Uncharacterized protein n=1 Tax=Portunus trituberculatus TaxID=210409 RepID=A0A5B7HGV5_PORTR|nr:hypothetical protein [Portunus trituberculatus]